MYVGIDNSSALQRSHTSWLLFLKYLDDLEQRRAVNATLSGKPFDFIIDTAYQWSTWAAPRKRDGTLDHDRALTGDDLLDFVNRELFPYLQGFRERASGPDTIEYKIGEIFSGGMPESDREAEGRPPCISWSSHFISKILMLCSAQT